MDNVSLWEATSNTRSKHPSLEGDQHCDVVIIGGGYSGLATSYFLQQKGVRTIILEKNLVGSGASGRNGGEVLTGFIGSASSLIKKKGLENAKRMFQMSLDSIDLIENIIELNGMDCSFKRNGSLLAAYKPEHVEGFKKEQEVLEKEFDYRVEVVKPEEIQSELKTTFYHGGRVDPSSAHFHPLNYALGLADAVVKHGGTIYENSNAIRVERENNKVIVHTDKGRVFAKEIVIVTNAYSGDLNKTIKRTIIPIESIMVATEPLPPEMLEELIKHDRAVSDTKHLLYYFRRTADNRVAFGGSGRSSSKRDQKQLFNRLAEGMVNVFPDLKDAKVEYQWGGKVGFTKEKLPYVGQLKDGTYFAFGYAGHGAAMSTYMGKVIAEKITSEEQESNPLEVNRVMPIPFHSQHEKAVSLMKYYYKYKDRSS
ncbi:FAD-binding oxidoreductase [Radiobacillus kanasensis]|uniref:NAD(P)/FAD-dependent oxidoreductase n=1 Tax=Radiobacillus kanasensis TaxID=2844358 RepID=UPI001E63BB60|nr:FAD-binding oxidoreductase [Radiobacillus kanasensis]UFT99092.1 FAD-binding oxidoreductase [Radiobacillus kanasensis]